MSFSHHIDKRKKSKLFFLLGLEIYWYLNTNVPKSSRPDQEAVKIFKLKRSDHLAKFLKSGLSQIHFTTASHQRIPCVA